MSLTTNATGFRLPTRVQIQPGCRSVLAEILKSASIQRLLLVVDPGLAATPWPEEVAGSLQRAGIHAEVFDAVEPNPRTTTASAAANNALENSLEAVVGLGGGSALDAAKAAAMLATNPGPVEDFTGKNNFSNTPLPFVAIPTTCGTGSEVTWVSVLSDPVARTKISVKGDAMFPDLALVDADLIASLPASLVAATGVDALTHALEATTGRAANSVSDALAEKAIFLLLRYLERATTDVESDAGAREAVMRASTLAGISFGNADVAGVHCLSESAGGLFDVPHGLTNAILLAPILRSHGDTIAGRLAELEGFVGGGDSTSVPEAAESFLSRIEQLTKSLGIPPWSAFGIPKEEHHEIAEKAEANGSNDSNPRLMRAADYLEVLDGLA